MLSIVGGGENSICNHPEELLFTVQRGRRIHHRNHDMQVGKHSGHLPATQPPPTFLASVKGSTAPRLLSQDC